jgi:hypothetical protein
MKTNFCTIVLFLMLTLLLSCNKVKNREEPPSPQEYEYVHLIPDSLLTPEQRELRFILSQVIVEYVTIEDNKFVLHLDREGFRKKGIPDAYYLRLLKDMQDNNTYIDSTKLENIKEMLDEAKQEMSKMKLE